jgi:hypothetical protein
MTHERSADQIIADIFGLPPSKRECALITRGALLEGRILDQQKSIEPGAAARRSSRPDQDAEEVAVAVT